MNTNKESIEAILPFLTIDISLKNIAEKVFNNERITFEEGVLLYEKGELGFVGMLANYIRNKKHGDNTYFNRNFHVEPTNICVYTCKFCSYSKLIKHREQGWEYTIDEIIDIIKNKNRYYRSIKLNGAEVTCQILQELIHRTSL